MNKNVTSPTVLKALMEEYHVSPLKRFGQNFLIDGNIADNIARAAVPKGMCALEIGPGMGALTSRLLEQAQVVAAYEIDSGLSKVLRDVFADESRFHLFHQDFLKADLINDLSELYDDKDIYVAANLPYYITSPCVMKLVESKLNIVSITVMMQKEVAERLCAKPGSKEYGAITAAVSYFAQPKLLFNVSAGCFYPKPDVSSAVVQLTVNRHSGQEGDAGAYLKTVKGMFAMRRKTLKSNLRQSFGLSAQMAAQVLEEVQIDENARAEMLSVNQFEQISLVLKKHIDFISETAGEKDFL
jgi:16S rRNA (adenine1518-N6/adenine1519-N6)-dimethyltransferase